MAKFVKSDIVVIPFPFSDLTDNKKRPALVIADLPGDDIILCQITSQQSKDSYAIAIKPTDYTSGSLPVPYNVRPTRIFTADKTSLFEKLEQQVRHLIKKSWIP